MTAKVSKEIANSIRANASFFDSYDQIIIYYDNGQIELTRILTSVFNALYADVEFRKVSPIDYKLFQVADLVCTVELLAEKAAANTFSHSEREFFGSPKAFRKEYLKGLRAKAL